MSTEATTGARAFALPLHTPLDGPEVLRRLLVWEAGAMSNAPALLEVIAVDAADARLAVEGGADRLELVSAMERGSPIDIKERQQRTLEERFQFAIGAALLLLIAEYWLVGRKGAA